MTEFTNVAPLIGSGPYLAEEIEFYVTHLGFTVTYQSPGGAGIRRGNVAFNVVENNNREWLENTSFSIGVGDLDAFYAEVKDIPARVSLPEMRPWGRREVHLIVPSGICFQFYQA
jgi:catechol 2,3-dioxygenase-like lactoylglutathione lyase family enzyme